MGINSRNWLSKFKSAPPADTTIISLGSNDLLRSRIGSSDYRYLHSIRKTIKGSVIWLVPADNPRAAANVLKIADLYGDATIGLDAFPLSPDHIHPTKQSYQVIAKELQ